MRIKKFCDSLNGRKRALKLLFCKSYEFIQIFTVRRRVIKIGNHIACGGIFRVTLFDFQEINYLGG